MTTDLYAVILVYSTSHAIRAEQLLMKAGIPVKLIPVPRHLSSDCGSCVRIRQDHLQTALRILEKAGLEIDSTHDL